VTRDIRQELGALPVFEGLSAADVEAATRWLTPVTLVDGSEICREDSIGRRAFIIISGGARVTRDGEEFAVLGAGDFAGVISLLDGLPCNATVTVVGATEALAMSSYDLAQVMMLPGVGDVVQRIADRHRAPHWKR
jgi:CRP-like cAMP-binding protein